jgi:hypothetical protein
MKLLSKLSTLIQAVARGPASRQTEPPAEAPTAGRTSIEPVQQTQQADAGQAVHAAQAQALEGGRVAELLQHKLASSETASRKNENKTASQESEKGD